MIDKSEKKRPKEIIKQVEQKRKKREKLQHLLLKHLGKYRRLEDHDFYLDVEKRITTVRTLI